MLHSHYQIRNRPFVTTSLASRRGVAKARFINGSSSSAVDEDNGKRVGKGQTLLELSPLRSHMIR